MFEIHYGIGPIRDFLTQPIRGWIGWVRDEGSSVVVGVVCGGWGVACAAGGRWWMCTGAVMTCGWWLAAGAEVSQERSATC